LVFFGRPKTNGKKLISPLNPFGFFFLKKGWGKKKKKKTGGPPPPGGKKIPFTKNGNRKHGFLKN